MGLGLVARVPGLLSATVTTATAAWQRGGGVSLARQVGPRSGSEELLLERELFSKCYSLVKTATLRRILGEIIYVF